MFPLVTSEPFFPMWLKEVCAVLSGSVLRILVEQLFMTLDFKSINVEMQGLVFPRRSVRGASISERWGWKQAKMKSEKDSLRKAQSHPRACGGKDCDEECSGG